MTTNPSDRASLSLKVLSLLDSETVSNAARYVFLRDGITPAQFEELAALNREMQGLPSRARVYDALVDKMAATERSKR